MKSFSPSVNHLTSSAVRLNVNYNETTYLLNGKTTTTEESNISEFIEHVFEALLVANRPVQIVAAINTIIFILWHTLDKDYMNANFISSRKNKNKKRWWCELLSSFSHIDLHHIGGNMAALAIFGPPTQQYLGTIRFIIFILMSAIMSSYTYTLWRDSPFTSTNTKKMGSLGFSGINSAMFIIYAYTRPNSMLVIEGNKVCTSTVALQTVILSDVSGLIIDYFGVIKSPIAHMAHLGGYVSGYMLLKAMQYHSKIRENLRKFLIPGGNDKSSKVWMLFISGFIIGYSISMYYDDMLEYIRDKLS